MYQKILYLTFFCGEYSIWPDLKLLLILAAAVGEEGTTIWPPSVLLFLAVAEKGFNSVSTPMIFQPPFAAFVAGFQNYS